MSDPIIGIDLGTTNSVASYTDEAGITHVIPDETGSRLTASAVFFKEDGSIVVGATALQLAQVAPERAATLFKRRMGLSRAEQQAPFEVDGKYWAPEELSALVLKKLADVASRWLSQNVHRAVVTVPYAFGEPERAATRKAGEIAGLEVVRIVNEPTAAAIAHGLDEPGEGRLLVFDFGGGTLDVTVLRRGADGALEVEASGGDRALGGADFDALIAEDMRASIGEQGDGSALPDWAVGEIHERAIAMKHMLSSAEEHAIALSVGGPPVRYTLTRERFETMLAESAARVEDAVRATLDKSGTKAGDFETVLMVGGSSRIPLFDRMVGDITGAQPLLTRNPDEDVSRGASMLAARMSGSLDPRSELARIPAPVDAASHALGIKLLRNSTREYFNKILIPEGTPIPFRATHTFYAIRDGVTTVTVTLNEGPEEDLDLVRQLKQATGPIGRAVKEDHPFRYEVEYTAEQLVVIKVFDAENGRFVCELEFDDTEGVNVESARHYLRDVDVS